MTKRFEWNEAKSVPARQLDLSEVSLSEVVDDMRAEYLREDLGKGVRGKYFERVSKVTNLILLDDQVATSFPTAEAVNQENLPHRADIDLLHTSTIAAHKERKHGKREVN